MKLCHRVSFVFLQQRHRVRGHFGLKNSACVSCGMRQRRLAAVGGHLCPACLQPPLPPPAAGSAQEQRPCCSGSCTPPSGQAQCGSKEACRTTHEQNSPPEYVRHFHKARLEKQNRVMQRECLHRGRLLHQRNPSQKIHGEFPRRPKVLTECPDLDVCEVTGEKVLKSFPLPKPPHLRESVELEDVVGRVGGLRHVRLWVVSSHPTNRSPTHCFPSDSVQ